MGGPGGGGPIWPLTSGALVDGAKGGPFMRGPFSLGGAIGGARPGPGGFMPMGGPAGGAPGNRWGCGCLGPPPFIIGGGCCILEQWGSCDIVYLDTYLVIQSI